MTTEVDPSPEAAQIGVIGLGVMGSSLALNVADRGYRVAVWNREPGRLESFLAAAPARQFVGARRIEDLVRVLDRPRRLLLMIKAGEPLDAMIRTLLPLVEPGDILIDGGNSSSAAACRAAVRVPGSVRRSCRADHAPPSTKSVRCSRRSRPGPSRVRA